MYLLQKLLCGLRANHIDDHLHAGVIACHKVDRGLGCSCVQRVCLVAISCCGCCCIRLCCAAILLLLYCLSFFVLCPVVFARACAAFALEVAVIVFALVVML